MKGSFIISENEWEAKYVQNKDGPTHTAVCGYNLHNTNNFSKAFEKSPS